ncbi:septum formation family protein [Cellulomonas dongxiuzhuiae]|uniref:Septum formation family protein n=1 Tax=Cellulomonas dongxiuzhuiae TaxID=2819979 RepID=A0ABX8GIN6_9CELL|nr:septum formation family protein [Cellulomonas dongxiuzhuiae]MBO3088096.1 septum formation family protein [Cellulomonas dongxiuzhuiae]MBO3094557.1 septum formation family protein [Cellulomonas dongxiuzhuiae]QWC15577.1 septum formation family protein [Cellulomonas dongxiuzhuiae]
MTTRSFRFLTAPVLAVALAAALTGCGVLDSVLGDSPEPAQRDEPGGEITASAEADVFSLQLGDCFDYAALSEATEISSVSTIPCGDPHDAEIYAETTLTEEQFQSDLALTTAGDTETPTVADQFCYDAFAGFVGKAYEESTLDYTLFSPSEEGWEQGDDVVQCIVLHPDGGFTGSMRDSTL